MGGLSIAESFQHWNTRIGNFEALGGLEEMTSLRDVRDAEEVL